MKKRFLPIAILSVFTTLFICSCAELFQGKIDIDTSSTLATLGDVLKEPVKIDVLETPAQLFVSDGDNPGTIRVSWSPVEGAQSYRLERAVVTSKNENGVFETPSEADFSPITTGYGNTAHIYGSTSFDDVILNNPSYKSPEYGYMYYYRVSAENESKGYGSSEFTHIVSGSLFAPPSGLTATAGSYPDKIELKWKPSASYSTLSYVIYRSMYQDGSNATFIASVKANMRSYTCPVLDVDRGTEYYFFVRAQNSARQESVDSSIALGYARAEGAPAQVQDKDIEVTRAEKTIKISWPVADSDTQYALYRSSTKDSALTLVTNGLSGSTYCSWEEDDSSLEYSTYYYYYVQPSKTSDGNLVKGPLSDTGPSSDSPKEAYLISPPETINVIKEVLGHQISWTPSIGNDNERSSFTYKIWGSNSTADNSFSEMGTIQSSSLTLINGFYYFEITDAKKYYRISTINNDQESPQSAIQAPAPFAPRSITVTACQNLSGEMGSSWQANVNEVYPVKITWQGPDDSSDVAGYYVYRSDKKDRGFKRLSVNNDEKTFAITGNTFYDINPTARPKQVYYYKVVSLNSLYGGANYSDTRFGYGALTADQYMREYNLTSANSHKKLTLMHKSGNTDKLGTETANGSISGTLFYNASIAGLGGRVIMRYNNYADFYIHNDGKMNSTPLSPGEEEIGTAKGVYFLYESGETNTSAEMSTNGTMDGTVVCKGMYPGSVKYDNIQIKGGAAGGGYYVVTRQGFAPENVHWTVAEE